MPRWTASTSTFSEPIDLTTFTSSAITLTRNGGPNLINGAVTITAVHGTDATYQIGGLTALTAADGAYTLTVSAAQVEDLGDNLGSGTATIQWSNGTAPPYVKQVEAVGPVDRNTPLDAVDVQLSLPIDPATFTTAALTLTRDGTAIPLPAGVTVSATDDARGRPSRSRDSRRRPRAEGNYSLTVDAAGLLGTDGLDGLGTASTSWVMDTTPPTLVSVQQPTTSPRNIVILSFNVTFSEPINLSTFDRSHVELDRDGTPITLDDRVMIQAVGGAVYQITGLNWFMGQQGSYKLIVNGDGVQDLAGNVGSGEASASWIMETTPPDAPTNVALTPDRGASDSDGVTNTEQVSITGSVDAPGLNVRVYDDTTGHEIGFAPADGLTFSVPVDLGAVGNHVLWVNAVDAAGNVSDNAVLDAFIDETPPTVEQVNGVPAAPTTSPVDALDIVFSKTINLDTLVAQDLTLTLERRPEPDQRRSHLQPRHRHDVSHQRPDRPDLRARYLPALARSHEGPGHRRQRGPGPVHGLVDGDPRGHDAADQCGDVAGDGQHVRLHGAVVGAGQSGRQRHRLLTTFTRTRTAARSPSGSTTPRRPRRRSWARTSTLTASSASRPTSPATRNR